MKGPAESGDMAESPDPIVASAARLCATLERVGDALVALDTETLLETEETLGRLLATLALGEKVHDKAALEPLVQRGREALLRCRRLGASFSGIARARLHLHTAVDAYGRDGVYVEPPLAGSALKARA